MLTYCDETHEYRWNGVVVPSVTQVLNEWLVVDDIYVNRFDPSLRIAKSAMLGGADRGKAIHDGLNILVSGRPLDWNSLDPSLEHPLRQAVSWMEKWDPVLVEIGSPMYSRKYGYAGTPDIFCMVKFGARRYLCLIDAKSGLRGLVGPQTAGYEQLYRERERYRGPIKRMVLTLPVDPKASYTFTPLDNRGDWDFFKACLVQKWFLDRDCVCR